jgi:hypothetical protein
MTLFTAPSVVLSVSSFAFWPAAVWVLLISHEMIMLSTLNLQVGDARTIIHPDWGAYHAHRFWPHLCLEVSIIRLLLWGACVCILSTVMRAQTGNDMTLRDGDWAQEIRAQAVAKCHTPAVDDFTACVQVSCEWVERCFVD